MPSNKFGEGDLLEYNAKYKLLICRRCQYAIQKNAIDSHLLRHKIYRGQRQELLSSIAHLDLLEPQEVALPSPRSQPVKALPVISGLRCVVTGCGHLTASSKRMRRHWSESHGLDGSVAISSTLAHDVKLQTFFRGTKVRYFEVAARSNPVASTEGDVVVDDDDNTNNNDDDAAAADDDCEGSEEEAHYSTGVPIVPPSPPSQLILPTAGENCPNPTDFNMETLSYFHHFTTETSPTLPSPSDAQYSGHYWQIHVIPLALQRRWLMCGILAVSAHHLAVRTKDTMVKKTHKKCMLQFSAEFFAELQQLSRGAFDFESAIIEAEPKQIGEQLRFLLQCARWTLPKAMNELEYVAHSRLPLFMSIVRGCSAPVSSIHYAGIPADTSNISGETFMQNMVQTQSSFNGPGYGTSRGDNTPSVVLDRLRMLPFRIAERVGRPESVKDVLGTMTAVTAMVKCCEAAFACSDALIMWQSIANWSTEVPDHFNQMLLRQHPAALITLAHWAAILVRRAENAGCWFLSGLSEEIMLLVSTQLANSDLRVLDLIENLTELAGN